MTHTTAGRSYWSRRVAMQLGGAAGLLSLLRGRAVAKPSQLVFATAGGALEKAYRQAVFADWQKSTGIAITTTANPAAKLKAMVEQKQVEWDVFQGAAELAAVLGKQGLLEPIDYSVVKKGDLLPGTAREFFVLTDFASYCIAWNTKNVPSNAPRRWSDVWAHKGRIGLWKNASQTLEVALLADGVAKDKLYPLDIERGLNSLAKIKDKVVWWSNASQGAQLILDGEVDVGAIWNGRIFDPIKAGAPVDYDFNEGLLISDGWAVPKGAPNLKESMELVALELSPGPQAAFANAIPYGPTNGAALKLIDTKRKADLPSSEANFAKGVMLDVDYWANNGGSVTERFNQWMLS